MRFTRPGGSVDPDSEQERAENLNEHPEKWEVERFIVTGELDASLRAWAMTATRAQIKAKLKPPTYKGKLHINIKTGEVRKLSPTTKQR